MSALKSLRSVRRHLSSVIRNVVRDDRGVTTEQVIWIAFLAALALTVTGLFGPQILAAAHRVTLK
ncbi:hypothetical protein AB0I98_35610 [Streptomyces sp. NPDC050211]|uniref:hypothetical protein n=1 Tax=Streptomyces sp. NPDC050211 TaxID=3154932 RepID=UPI003431B4C6